LLKDRREGGEMSELDEVPSAIETLLARAEECADVRTQFELLARAASLYESRGDLDGAFLVRSTAYRLVPAAGERVELERLAAVTNRTIEFDQLLLETTPELPMSERAEAWCALGRLRLSSLRAPERALEALDRSLARGFSTAAAHLRVDALEALGRHAEQAAALDELSVRALTDQERAVLSLRLAELRERLGDAAGAEEASRRVLALDPLQSAARSRLERLVRGRGDQAALLALLDDRRALEEDLVALEETAQLSEALGRRSDSAERWEQVRRRRPADPAPLRALDRLYAELGRLRDRAAVLEALVGVVERESERAALHRELSAAWGELGDRSRAIASLEWLLVYEPGEPALRALEPLYRAERRFGALVDALQTEAKHAEPSRRVALERELAALYEHELDDAGQAIRCWESIVAARPDDAEALDALARLCESVEAFDRAADAREKWAALAAGRERALRRVRAAELCASSGDARRAEELLAAALADDARAVPIRLALAASLAATDRLADALALLDQAPAPVHPALLALAARLREAHEPEKALANLRAVLDSVPDHIEARRRACTLAQKLGHHAQVIDLATALPDEGALEVRLERWLALARAGLAHGDRALAGDAIAHATELAPGRFVVRQLEAERLIAEDRASEAEALLPSLEERAASDAERAAAAFLAGQCAHARGDAEVALAHNRRAVGLDPGHRVSWRRLLDITVEMERWDEALDALSALVDLELDPRLRARYRHLAGHVCEEELGLLDDALEQYRAALADDPDHPRTAERIEALLCERGDFAGLAEHCARMLERLGNGDPARKAQLWSRLADAADGAGDREGAIAALEVVIRLDAEQKDARRRLAALYLEAGPDAAERAIVAHHELLRRDPVHVPTYRALAGLYQRVGARDRSLACDRAARLLSAREATPRTRARPEPVLATRALGPDEWRLVRHPDEDRFLSVLSMLLSPVLAQAAVPARAPGVPVGRDDGNPFAQATAYVSRTLDVPMPDLFARDDQKLPVQVVHGRVPGFVIGLPLLGDRRRFGDLVAPLALEAALLRPERHLRLLVGEPRALALLLRAVIALAHDEAPTAGEAVTAAALKRRLPPLALDQVGVIGRRLRDEGRDLTQLAASWLRAADLTAARAALAITGDLERTIDAVEACAASPAAARAAEHELIWASVTDELWTVRKRLEAAPGIDVRLNARV
jgi:predicted Zn-dependent protease